MSKNDSNINTKDFLIGTLIGGIVGAFSALMLSPKSGKEIRESLTDQTGSLRQKSSNWVSLAKDKTSQIAQTVQSREMAEKVRDWKDQAKTKSLEIVSRKSPTEKYTSSDQHSYYEGDNEENDENDEN